MPVRLLTQSRLRWPEAAEVLAAVVRWAEEQAERNDGLHRVGVFGSYGRGDAGVGSDLDLVLIDDNTSGTQSQRYRQWPFEQLPLSGDALVLTQQEWDELLASPATDATPDPGLHAMANALHRDCHWLWCRTKAEGTCNNRDT